MALPTCDCIGQLPTNEKLDAIYCALNTLVENGSITFPITVPQGGTGLTSFTTGDIVYASAATTLAGLADVATGNVLLSGGVGAAPAYGKVGLTTHVSGTLPVANGGTGLTALPKFAAYASANQAITGGNTDQVIFDTEEYDVGGNYAANAFTAPVAAKYHFTAAVFGDTSTVMALYLYKNGSQFKRLNQNGGFVANGMMRGSASVESAAGDIWTIRCFVANNSNLIGASTIAYFMGEIIP